MIFLKGFNSSYLLVDSNVLKLLRKAGFADIRPAVRAKIKQVYVPRPEFHARPVSKEEIDKKISERNSKRDLCGW